MDRGHGQGRLPRGKRPSLPRSQESDPAAVAELEAVGIRIAASGPGKSLTHCVTLGKTLNLSGP